MPTGRYAPSPTGTFHLGNLRTALAAWLFARHDGARCLLRWEDLDPTARAEHEASQRRDLERLGLEFDGRELHQSSRLDVYRDALADLHRRGLTYPCWCSRRDIREATRAPHAPPGSYPGTCRSLTRAQRAERAARGRPPAIRFRAEPDLEVTVVDRLHGPFTGLVDDMVLQRFDGTPGYHLTVVVDDAAQGVGEVVRGDDLLASTPRHAALHHALGTPEPVWTHVPLVADHTGVRLAKRDGSAGLDAWCAAGGTVDSLLCAFAASLGVATETARRPPPVGARLAEIAAGFDPARVPLATTRVDPGGAGLSIGG